MIKTIKIKKKMSFRELMEHIFSKSEEVRGEEFKSKNGDHSIKINTAGRIFFRHREPKGTDAFNHGETYEINVEEKITEYTKLDNLIEVAKDNRIHTYGNNSTLNEVKDNNSIAFYVPIDGELVKIWECE